MEFHYQNPKVLYHGKRVDFLTIDAPHPKGGTIQREVISHPGAVVLLPILDEENIILIRNGRYVVQKVLWELPAGTLEKDEKPILCAKRELEEETGYRAGEIAPLLQIYSTPGFCNEILYIFVAKDLTYIGQNLDETEKIDVEIVPLDQALSMIKEGIICDAKTIASLLFYNSFRKNI